jgi:hypothetical protein
MTYASVVTLALCLVIPGQVPKWILHLVLDMNSKNTLQSTLTGTLWTFRQDPPLDLHFTDCPQIMIFFTRTIFR